MLVYILQLSLVHWEFEVGEGMHARGREQTRRTGSRLANEFEFGVKRGKRFHKYCIVKKDPTATGALADVHPRQDGHQVP